MPGTSADLTFECGRVYLPSAGAEGLSQSQSLKEYAPREFPESAIEAKSYAVPRTFTERAEVQASQAERIVFQRLQGLKGTKRPGLWVLFFHGATYGGHSSRNEHVGKLMIREHDFVAFTKYKGKFYVTLTEVKSTHDARTKHANIQITSDAKSLKNNKRSAQHQIRDHLAMLCQALGTHGLEEVQRFIMWPFLSAWTKDPKQVVTRRWKEDGNLHLFEDNLETQDKFDEWFNKNVLGSTGIEEEVFTKILNRFIVLSCGVFVEEINQGMLALLTQNQLEILTSSCGGPGYWGQGSRGPLIVHGAAGTGKTLLVVKKIQLLYEQGKLDAENRALYICYWPGIRCDLENKLKALGLDMYVDSARFYISQTGFLLRNLSSYKHIFMDEAEAICLAFEDSIMLKTLASIYQRYHDGNCKIVGCRNVVRNYKTADDCIKIFDNHSMEDWGELWFLVDINQASLFLPKHSPNILRVPTIVLNRVMRSTGYIFDVFKQFYLDPMPKVPKKLIAGMKLNEIAMGHDISGPPILWVNPDDFYCQHKTDDCSKLLHSLTAVVIDLCVSKGITANTMCIIPFLVNDSLVPETLNREITSYFVENGYRPTAVGDVEKFLIKAELNEFLIAWALRVKGLEFKVVIVVMDDEDFDISDAEDRKKMYIMASRCTCMLIIVCPKLIKDAIDKNGVIQDYSFSIKF